MPGQKRIITGYVHASFGCACPKKMVHITVPPFSFWMGDTLDHSILITSGTFVQDNPYSHTQMHIGAADGDFTIPLVRASGTNTYF
jgi:hypothetical protein